MIQKGRISGGDNTPSAEPELHLRAYSARKWRVGMRSALVILPLAAGAAIWRPLLGLDLVLGGICGVGNMLLSMHNNERLLERGRSRGMYGLSNLVRIVSVCLVPVFAAAHHPWWYMLVALAGVFAPLVLYSLELRRELLTG